MRYLRRRRGMFKEIRFRFKITSKCGIVFESEYDAQTCKEWKAGHELSCKECKSANVTPSEDAPPAGGKE
jgi:hypothetical protein